MEDRITQLPDEIVVSILSFLSIKEAARTSALSRRWEKLWTFITTSFNFDASKITWEIERGEKSLKKERYNYIGWVNKVLGSHQGSTIEEFRVHFHLNTRSKRYIDKWVEFAISKRVQRLELDFSPVSSHPLETMRYTFPQHCFDLIRSSGGLSCLRFLTHLCLKFVNVSGEIVEYFLSHCMFLERLCIVGSEHLVNLEVGVSLIQLKVLEISVCNNLKRVEVCAPNLVFFKYEGQRIELNFGNVPLLRDLSLGGKCCKSIGYAFSSLSDNLHQLVTLKLEMCLIEENMEFPQFPVLINLKNLTWRVHASDETSLLSLTSLLVSSPFVHTFKFELIWHGTWKQRKAQKAAKCPNQYLKVVELVGFVGHTIDVELGLYLLESAIMLEKIVVDPRSPYIVGSPWQCDEREEYQVARKRAQQFETKLPPGAKLVIL